MRQASWAWLRSEPKLLVILSILIAFLFSAMDAILLHRTSYYFGGGALNRPFFLEGVAEYLLFFVQSIIYDFVAYFLLAALLLGALRTVVMPRLNSVQHLFVVFWLILSVVLGVTVIKYKISAYFGDAFNLTALKDVAGGRIFNAFAWMPSDNLLGMLAVPAVAIVLIVCVVLLRPLGRYVEPWRPGGRTVAVVLMGSVFLVADLVVLVPYPSLRYGMSAKVSVRVVDAAIHQAWSYDRNPILAAGLESVREAGPEEVEKVKGLPGIVPAERITDTNGKNVFVIVIETFRHDVVSMSIDGEPVMPFFARLLRENAGSTFAVSNYGVTARAIQTVMAGSLHYDRDSAFLPNQLQRLGYRRYAVSAQDETFGETRQILGLTGYDAYYDASMKRWDLESLPTWVKLNPMSLTLDGRETDAKVFEFLDAATAPFFFYINFQDTHHPYFESLMPLHFIETGHVDSAFFGPDNVDAIKRQYANAAHHLDDCLRVLFDGLRSRGLLDNSVIVIVGDHPDSIYENGLLGHGWSVDEAQRRTPLIVVNGRGHAVAPLGQNEIFSIVRDSLQPASNLPPLSITHDPAKRVFVVGGQLTDPRQIAFLGDNTLISYDFLTNMARFGVKGVWRSPGRLKPDSQEAGEFDQLVAVWRGEMLLQKNPLRP